MANRVNMKGRSWINTDLLTVIEIGVDESGKDCIRYGEMGLDKMHSISYDHESDRDEVYKKMLGIKDTKPFAGLGNRA